MYTNLTKYGWRSPYQDYLFPSPNYSETISQFSTDFILGTGRLLEGIEDINLSSCTIIGQIPLSIYGATWINIIDGELVEDQDIRIFTSEINHIYYDLINNSFIIGDGGIKTVINNTGSAVNMAVYDLTLMGYDSFTIEQVKKIFHYVKGTKSFDPFFELKTKLSKSNGSIQTDTIVVDIFDQSNIIKELRSLLDGVTRDSIHIQPDKWTIIKKVEEDINVEIGTIINYEDMAYGGRFIAYNNSGTYQIGIKGESLSIHGDKIHYQLLEEKEIVIEIKKKLFCYGPNTMLQINPLKEVSLSTSPIILYQVPIDKNLAFGYESEIQAMKFKSEGFLYNQNTYYNDNNILKVSTSFLSKSIDNGLVLWYNNTIGNIIFSCNDTKLEIKKTYLNRETIVKNTTFDILGITPPVEDETINLKAEINKNYVIFYYNDQLVFEIEDYSFNGGQFGLFGDVNAVCTSFSIEAKEPVCWQYYTELGTTIKRIGEIPNLELEIIIADDTTPKNAYIYQDVNIQDAGTYTLSFDYIGSVYTEIYQDDTLLDLIELNSVKHTKGTNVFDITSPGLINIRIGSRVKGNAKIAKPQLEYKSFNTSYVSDIRGSSKVTFPAKKLNKDLGAFGLWIIPSHDYSTGSLPIFYYNDSFRLDYSGENFILSYGTKTLSINKQIDKGKTYYISCSWESQLLIILNIFDKETGENTTNSITIGQEDIEDSDFIYVGSTPIETGNLTIDNLVVMNGPITLDEVRYHRYQEELYDERIIFKCGFNMETFNYDKNRVSVPIPRVDYPIIVHTSEGKEYNRVYFLDEEDNYTLYCKEKFTFNGERILDLRFNNIIKAIAYSSIIRNNFANTIEGNQITLNNIDIKVEKELLSTSNGMVYNARFKNWMKDRDIIIEMEDEEGSIVVVPEEEYVINYEDGSIQLPGVAFLNIYASYNYTDYIGKEITVMYIIRDTYCINYSDIYDQYEFQLSNVDGNDIHITYQNTDGVLTKRLRNIELNPFKSVNNSGFIYIEGAPRELSTFDVKITPDSLVANGNDTATITIDCLSNGGTPTSNVDLEVRKTIASNKLYRYISPEEQEWIDYKDRYGEEDTIRRYGNIITDEHRAGRFIYKYTAGTQITEAEKIDNITITDKISGIEIQIPIRLVRE